MYSPGNIAILLWNKVMKKKNASLFDHAEREFADNHLDELLSESDYFFQLEDRTREGLWSLLGGIYELVPKIENVAARKERLITRVAQRPDVADNNQWRPSKKKVDDLLLVLLFGLERRQTKSQRLAALRVAAKQGIEPTRAAFVEWIRQIGGVDGASELAKGPAPRKDDLRSCADQLKDFEAGFSEITTPETLTDIALPEGFPTRGSAQGATGLV